MKRKLLCLLITFLAINLQAQTISIVGTGVNGWPPTTGPEIVLSTTDNVNYTISNLAITAGVVKFRQDLDWAINWGANSFPTGIGTQNGPDIPTLAGVYTVNFNRTTGEYNFIANVVYPLISLSGTSVGGFDMDVNLGTSDGVTYTLVNRSFTLGECKFRQDHDWLVNWGAINFPSGTGTQGGVNIPVPEATFNVTFNRNTGDYDFDTVSIGIIGTAVNGWDLPDVDLHTTDNVNFLLTNYPLVDGEAKFRQDDAWSVNWGGAFPADTGVINGANLQVTAGNYDIAFNRNTLAYSFTGVLGTNEVIKNNFKVFPNPTTHFWNFVSGQEPILSVTITDILGKVVTHTSLNTVDASALTNGVYFAQIQTAHASQMIKVVKQ